MKNKNIFVEFNSLNILIQYSNDINGLGRTWVVSIGVKEKPSAWEGDFIFLLVGS